MSRHMDLNQDRKAKHTNGLHEVPGLRGVPPHLELEAVAAHRLETPAFVESECILHIVSAVVIVPQQLVVRTSAEK